MPTDENGLTGRECPNPDCLGYFKVEFGTGLQEEDLPCHCPYCGHTASHNEFWTQEQIEYVRSLFANEVSKALRKDFREWDRQLSRKTRGGFFQLKLEYKSSPHPIRYYQEKDLETEIVCNNCTLHYAIYGVFGYCPDCAVHNSCQILEKNLELAKKELELAENTTDDEEFSSYLVADALENVVSAFDGFGRETVRIHSSKSSEPNKAKNISFQNLTGANKRLRKCFGFNLAVSLSPDEWDLLCKCFQKRHLLAHRMGVVDEAYINATGDTTATIGRKISIEPEEIHQIIDLLRRLGEYLIQNLATS
jgi:hypothetical protein